MNFASKASVRPRDGELVTLMRSTYRGPLERVVWTGTEATLFLWWGPVLQVRPGDTILYFPSPIGVGFEAIERAPTPT